MMISNKKIPFVVMVIVLMSCGNAAYSYGADWPQFLGSDRNSTSPQTGLLRNWNEAGPEVLWVVEVGRGYGGPVVKNGKVYLLDRDDEVGDMMRCFDLQTGVELWKFAYAAPGELPFPGSRSVPIVDDRNVYSVGQFGNLYSIDIQTQKPVWSKNIWTDFGGARLPTWGITQSPLIYGDLLIVAPQAPQAGVVAYNKHTGDVVWQTPNFSETITDNYVSPKLVKIHGEEHLVMTTSSTNLVSNRNATSVMGKVTGIEPLTGRILWQHIGWDCHITVPCAVDAGENKLLITGGYNLGAMMIRVDKKADGAFEATELFRTTDFGSQNLPPILHNGYFYAMYRTNSKREGFVCMNKNGEIMWKTGRNPDFDRGSMILVGGLILATDGMQTLYLIEPDPTGFKAISQTAILREGGVPTVGMSVFGGSTQNWAPIALADGKLLIRDQSRLICLKVAK